MVLIELWMRRGQGFESIRIANGHFWPGPVRGHGSPKRSEAKTGLAATGSLWVLRRIHTTGQERPSGAPLKFAQRHRSSGMRD